MSLPNLFLVAAAVALLLLLRLPSRVVSQGTCTTQANNFPSNRTYLNCTDLPHLNATLHFTYDPANSSLSVAYIASPAPGGAWIAWAINPVSTGMLGSQALVALKPTGGSAVVAKTFNVSSYSSVIESPLSFAVWGLAADEVNRTMRLFGSVKVPGSATSLNQVWQVGGAVNGTQPQMHPLSADNKLSKATLSLVMSEAPAPSPGGTVAALPPPPSPAKNGGNRLGGRNWWSFFRIAGGVALGLLAF